MEDSGPKKAARYLAGMAVGIAICGPLGPTIFSPIHPNPAAGAAAGAALGALAGLGVTSALLSRGRAETGRDPSAGDTPAAEVPIAPPDAVSQTAVGPATPEEIKRRIQDQLMRLASEEGKGIRVLIHGGCRVVLEGKVHSYSEATQAEEIAWSTPGVAGVDNRLDVAA